MFSVQHSPPMAGAVALAVLLILYTLLWMTRRPKVRHRLSHGHRHTAPVTVRRNQRKPQWVRREVLRLQALMPQASCRNIARIFNRRFGRSRRMTVGPTFVWKLVTTCAHEILLLRKEIKNRRPRPVPLNAVWGVDLTGKGDTSRRQHVLLGVIEHGARACLVLKRLADASSLSILIELVQAMKQYGVPGAIRTDNGSVVTSSVFRFALRLLGIRHQRIDRHAPWQNGRVERFFGTLKEVLDRWAVDDALQLDRCLHVFRFWYNHVRFHLHLDGATPAEAWSGTGWRYGQGRYFEAWDGLLTGFYFGSG